jgi:tripartite-type tricarboxylate transporter receptor subunit TctC
MIGRRGMLAGTSLLLASPRPARAQESWPSRPIRFLVGSSPGGSQDATARIIAPGVSARLGQTLVVENRGGGGGMLTFEPVLRASPDGYTIAMGNMGSILVTSITEPDLPIKPLEDLAPVALVADVVTVLVTLADHPWRSLAELVQAARSRPQELTWAHPGIGSSPWLAGLLLDELAGIRTTGVPYRGGAPAVVDLLTGRIDFTFATTPTVLPLIRSGKLRALAVPTPARVALMPDVPTVAEQGYPDFIVGGWFAIMTTPGTPPAVIAKLNAAINETTADPAVVAKLAEQGQTPLRGTPEEFVRFGAAERAKWTPIARAASHQARN